MDLKQTLIHYLRRFQFYIAAFVGGALLAFGYSYAPLHSSKDWKIDYLQERVELGSDRIRELEQELADLQSAAGEAPNPEVLKELEGKVKSADAKVRELEGKAKKSKRRIAELERSRDSWKAKHEEAEERSDELVAKIENLTRKQALEEPVPSTAPADPSPMMDTQFFDSAPAPASVMSPGPSE